MRGWLASRGVWGEVIDPESRPAAGEAPRRRLREPGILPRVLLGAPQHGMRADDQNAPQVAVALLGGRPELLNPDLLYF
jgi:hypothetical protein